MELLLSLLLFLFFVVWTEWEGGQPKAGKKERQQLLRARYELVLCLNWRSNSLRPANDSINHEPVVGKHSKLKRVRFRLSLLGTVTKYSNDNKDFEHPQTMKFLRII